jgi:RHS repeat-associated protein
LWAYGASYTPTKVPGEPRGTEGLVRTTYGVELASGALRWPFPLYGFPTRKLGFDFELIYASLVDYRGAFGAGMSHSFNMMIVQTGATSGLIITANLRVYEIGSEDGVEWDLPAGFFSRLHLDQAQRRWQLTHFAGTTVVFYQAAPGHPGYPIAIGDPNGNLMRLEYDTSGQLQRVSTDLGQVQELSVGSGLLYEAVIDHLGRRWSMQYDDLGQLSLVASPVTPFADIGAGDLLTDSDLAEVLVQQSRRTNLLWSAERQLASITDERDATPYEFGYDSDGRVEQVRANGNVVQIIYEPQDNPEPLDLLDEGNFWVRWVDREGNTTDYELHGSEGGPLAGAGAWGLRRSITWTEIGKGNDPLREGDPEYFERRLLQDCDCLAPHMVAQPFSSDEIGDLELGVPGIPLNWPREIYERNRFAQIEHYTYTDGLEVIRTESTYQPGAFGDGGEYSRLLQSIDPRTFDDNPLYAGLVLAHRYEYDPRGNLIRRLLPTVTRGVPASQPIAEEYVYNLRGQLTGHVDANGNRTSLLYFPETGAPAGSGDVNTKGQFGGYLAAVTRGAAGSADPAPALTTSYRVNALGKPTQRTDGRGFIYEYTYNDLLEIVAETKPEVGLRGGARVRYEVRWVYDGAGNPVMQRESNVDVDGSSPANDFVDESRSFDAVNNLLAVRREVDGTDGNDLVTSYAYDRNDDRSVVQYPKGNREFTVYDERRLRLKRFTGVAPGSSPTEGFPADKRMDDLGSLSHVALESVEYDSRGNLTVVYDGRGFLSTAAYDFRNRLIAHGDQNQNGWVARYDDASNPLTRTAGSLLTPGGQLQEGLARTYYRYDEAGRLYETVYDIELTSDESAQLSPGGGVNSRQATVFDAGSRIVQRSDANGNFTSYDYDAADRPTGVSDSLGNTTTSEYDANSNLVRRQEREVAGPGATGAPEIYAHTYEYDELNRRVAAHTLGLAGTGIDHVTSYAYDSRDNLRLEEDAEGQVAVSTFDDADRHIATRRYDGDPFGGSAAELMRSESGYDRNSRLIEQRLFSDVGDPGSMQIGSIARDDLDRATRYVLPDADDPIDGSSNGADGIYDRIEVEYDAGSNPVRVREQRGVVFNNTFDAGNRLVEQRIDLPVEVPGVRRQTYDYDVLDRIISARNDFSRTDRTYDALSRLTAELQSIRLDGTGFANGWEQAIRVASAYDRQSNRTGMTVFDGVRFDLAVDTAYDALNRVDRISAAYFGQPSRQVADYVYFGRDRLQAKLLGNGAQLLRTYDGKRRLARQRWEDPLGAALVELDYSDASGSGYDAVDNGLIERFEHDGNLADLFGYNRRYEVTGAEYRSDMMGLPSQPHSRFEYDDAHNRTVAAFGSPFETGPSAQDTYAINRANEYVGLTRNGVSLNPATDAAGNADRVPVRPVAFGSDADVSAPASWDAFDRLYAIQPQLNAPQEYRYDAFGRRIASLLGGVQLFPDRRYVYDGWSVAAERLFELAATPANAPSVLERVYVNGRAQDEVLLTAIDRNGDAVLGGSNSKNVRDAAADQEYYFLANRLGSIMALLDADNPRRVLEYYRYNVFGEAVIMPVLEDAQGLETTPDDLADNFAAGAQRASTELGNVYLFAGRRFDGATGLYYNRHRYYEPRMGRFISRDPLGLPGALLGRFLPEGADEDGNLYHYTHNRTVSFTDPMGTQSLSPYLQAAHERALELTLQAYETALKHIPEDDSILRKKFESIAAKLRAALGRDTPTTTQLDWRELWLETQRTEAGCRLCSDGFAAFAAALAGRVCPCGSWGNDPLDWVPFWGPFRNPGWVLFGPPQFRFRAPLCACLGCFPVDPSRPEDEWELIKERWHIPHFDPNVPPEEKPKTSILYEMDPGPPVWAGGR